MASSRIETWGTFKGVYLMNLSVLSIGDLDVILWVLSLSGFFIGHILGSDFVLELLQFL